MEKAPVIRSVPINAKDGTPHIAYYIPEFQLSFVWNGHLETPIEVCRDGYAEPVRWEIPVSQEYALRKAYIFLSLAEFRLICEEWTQQQFMGGG